MLRRQQRQQEERGQRSSRLYYSTFHVAVCARPEGGVMLLYVMLLLCYLVFYAEGEGVL